MKCKCLCVAVGLVYHCVCIYRCIHLKALTVCWCYKVTDAGISMVISQCNQLRILDLKGLKYITGMCALCEVPEPTLCFITLWCMIFLQQVHH
jgi:bacterioferritin-associated ferredoxin